MPKIDLAVIKAQMRNRTPEALAKREDFATIFAHGAPGTGKTTLWGQFGLGDPHTACLIQGDVGDRDLDNPDIDILDVNGLFNIGRLTDLTISGDGDIVGGDFDDVSNAAMGWDYAKTAMDDLIRTGGKNISPVGKPYRHVIWDTGTMFQQMCLAWVMRNMPSRNRPPGPDGGIRASLEDYGDAVMEFNNWLLLAQSLKRRMNCIILWHTFEVKSQEIAPDGYSMMDILRYMPMVFGKKLPTQIVGYADFAPFHQQVQMNVMVPINPEEPNGKKQPQSRMVRGLRWQPTNKIYAKGRGKLADTTALMSPWDKVDGVEVGWGCHRRNLERICAAGNIPL